MTGIVIRPEVASDREAVFALNAAAFETSLEARLVDVVREASGLIVSAVAELDGRVVGHLLLSPLRVERNPDGLSTLGLGPMAVAPELQRQGIGSRLVEHGLEVCRRSGVSAVFVLGHADYYPRFGFQPARARGLYYQDEEFDPYFMVLEIEPGCVERLEGAISYHPAFEGEGEAEAGAGE